MKKTFLLSFLALLLSLLMPQPRAAAPQIAPAPAAPLLPTAETAPPLPSPLPSLAPSAPPSLPQLPATIRLLAGKETLELDLQDYLCGVLAAEMPASFPEEALKALAFDGMSFVL